MRIRSVTTLNFMGHDRCEATNLAPATVISGPMGSGKSTIRSAIEVALTGACYDATGKRVEQALYRRDDSKDMMIRVVVDGLRSGNAWHFNVLMQAKKKGLQRTATIVDGAGDPESFKADDQLAVILEGEGIEAEDFEFSLNPQRILMAGGLNSILGDHLMPSWDKEDLLAFAKEMDDPVFPLWLKSDMEGSPAPNDPESLTRAGATYYKLRTVANKSRDAVVYDEGMDLPESPDGTPIPASKLRDVVEALGYARENVSILNRKLGQWDAGVIVPKHGRQEIARLEAAREEALREFKEAKAAQGLLETEGDPEGSRRYSEWHLAETEAEKAAEQESVAADYASNLRDLLRARVAELAGKEDMLDSVRSTRLVDVCFLCGQQIPEEMIAAANASIDEKVSIAETKLEAVQAQHDAIAVQSQEAEGVALQWKTEADRRKSIAEGVNAQRLEYIEARAAAKLPKAQEATARLERARASIAELEGKIKALQSDIAKAEALTPREALEKDLEETQARVGRGEDAQRHLEAWIANDAKREDHDRKAHEADMLNLAVKMFKDGRFLAHISAGAEDARKAFVSRCNVSLESLGMALDVGMSGKDLFIKVATQGSGGTFLPYPLLSGGERCMIEYALATGLAPGLIAIVDEVNAVDDLNQVALFNDLATRATGPGQVIAIAATGTHRPIGRPGIADLWMEDGTVKWD